MGNGMLGLMIYKEPNANYLRFETGNCALHDHRPGSNDLFHACRLLTGHFELHPQGTIEAAGCASTCGTPRQRPTSKRQQVTSACEPMYTATE